MSGLEGGLRSTSTKAAGDSVLSDGRVAVDRDSVGISLATMTNGAAGGAWPTYRPCRSSSKAASGPCRAAGRHVRRSAQPGTAGHLLVGPTHCSPTGKAASGTVDGAGMTQLRVTTARRAERGRSLRSVPAPSARVLREQAGSVRNAVAALLVPLEYVREAPERWRFTEFSDEIGLAVRTPAVADWGGRVAGSNGEGGWSSAGMTWLPSGKP